MMQEAITKQKIKERCLHLVNTEIEQLKEAIVAVQGSSNNETKSTAGDKHETSKAMAQIEVERLNKQLEKQLLIRSAFGKVNPENKLNEVGLGALVTTTAGNFFVSAGLGKVTIDKVIVFVISPVSPIGKELIKRKEGEKFLFKGKEENILRLM